jgi:hypothetical protein
MTSIYRPEMKVKPEQLVTTGTPSASTVLAGDGSYIYPEPYDVVGGRLDLVSATSLKWGFQNSNQIKLYNDSTSRWELIRVATEPTLANTAYDIGGVTGNVTLQPNTIYDVFAEYSSATAFTLVCSRWATGGDGANNASTSYATPVMTALGTPGPFVVSASSTLTTYYAYKAFDQAATGGVAWLSNTLPTSGSPQSVMIDFGADNSVVINKYALQCADEGAESNRRFPKDFKLQGSNAAVTVSSDTGWVDLETAHTNVADPGQNTWSSYWTFVNNQPYRYYRLRITATNGSSQDYTNVTNLKLVAAANSLAGSSSRVRAYESTVTYNIGDRVTNGGHDWVKISTAAAGTTPAAGNDWVDNGTSVTGDFAGLYRHDGVLVSSNSATGKKRRWLGIIYTYNNAGTVNFKDDANYRYISNFYNRKSKTVQATNSTTSWTYQTATFREGNGATGQSRASFILATSDVLNLNMIRQVYGTSGGAISAGVAIGLNQAVTPISVAQWYIPSANAPSSTNVTTTASDSASIVAGYNWFTELEYSGTATPITFYGYVGSSSWASSRSWTQLMT